MDPSDNHVTAFVEIGDERGGYIIPRDVWEAWHPDVRAALSGSVVYGEWPEGIQDAFARENDAMVRDWLQEDLR